MQCMPVLLLRPLDVLSFVLADICVYVDGVGAAAYVAIMLSVGVFGTVVCFIVGVVMCVFVVVGTAIECYVVDCCYRDVAGVAAVGVGDGCCDVVGAVIVIGSGIVVTRCVDVRFAAVVYIVVCCCFQYIVHMHQRPP